MRKRPFETTPIYKECEDIVVRAHQISANMPKQHRYTTGERLCDKCELLMENVAEAYCEKQDMERKRKLVKDIPSKSRSVLIQHRIVSRLSIISKDLYTKQINSCISVTKQANNWYKQLLTYEDRSIDNEN